jgi:hypothetical protein
VVDILEALLNYHAFLQEEATVYEAMGNVIKLAVAHRMIGEVYSSMGQYDKALKHQMKHLGMIFLVFGPHSKQRWYIFSQYRYHILCYELCYIRSLRRVCVCACACACTCT